jgi:CheY-like chemotaxis protein
MIDHTVPVECVTGAGELILAVEDNANLRWILDRQLRGLGYRALFAEDAGTALAVLEWNSEIRLLFTDVMMPGGMSGIELAREAALRWPRLHVLLTSGFARAAVTHAGFDPPLPHLLSKPYRKDELARALRRAFDEAP